MTKLRHFFSEHKLILSLLLLAACARFIKLDSLPNGVYPDEAYNAYNTWSLMSQGVDSRGYHAPVYFTAWGSGMNALYAYLALPLFRIFGTGITVFRLPQALVSLASVYAFYLLGQELFNRKTGCFMAFVLAINPWSIMNARFGLESTLAPGMLLFAFTFLVLGLKKNPRCLFLSALFMAASLYGYSLTWIALPVILILTLLLYRKRIPFQPVTVLSAALLFLAAIPLLLFLAVNLELIDEIATPVFSVPRLLVFRGEELAPRYILQNMKSLFQIILSQYDGASHTSSSLTGAYYLFTAPFCLLGIVIHMVKFFKSYKRGDNDLQYLFLLWLAGASVVALLQKNMTMIHINLIHIPFIFYGVYGIIQAAYYAKSRLILPACLIFFSISFVWFVYDYGTQPDTHFYGDTAEDALNLAKNMAMPEQNITIVGYTTIQCGTWMWFEKPDPIDFSSNVVYIDDPAWGQIGSYGRFRYVYSIDSITGEDIYICPNNSMHLEKLIDMGLTVIPVNDRYLIAGMNLPLQDAQTVQNHIEPSY